MKFPQSLHLIEEFKKSDRYILTRNVESIRHSYSIFCGNYKDLKKALTEHSEKSNDGSMWDDDELRWELQDNIVRLMYNFFSSAFTLVNHTRNHNRKLYKATTSIAKEYQEYINANFAGDALHCFVIDFRNFMCHSALPFIVSSKQYSKSKVTTSFKIKKNSMQKFKWEPISREFLKSLPETFNLEEIVDNYFDKVEDLHKWYSFKQLQFHKDLYTDVLIEKKALLKLAIADRITQALPFNQTDIDREERILQTLY